MKLIDYDVIYVNHKGFLKVIEITEETKEGAAGLAYATSDDVYRIVDVKARMWF